MDEPIVVLKNPKVEELKTRETVNVILLFPGGAVREVKMKAREVYETIGQEADSAPPRFFVESKMQDPEDPDLWIYRIKNTRLAKFMNKYKNKRDYD